MFHVSSRNGLACVLAFCVLSPAGAEASLERLHRTVTVGSLVCFADHTHRGGSRPMPTRAGAYADALRSWGALVRLEYGDAWAVFDQSAGRQVTCQPAHGLRGEPAWTCHVASRPCRPAR
jgi:hypothetical protein